MMNRRLPHLLFVFCATFLPFALSQAEPKLITSHAIAMHGDIKYPANFERFAYTSKNAKQGGKLTLFAFGSFDSFNPFIIKGEPADNVGLLYQTLLVTSLDEPFTMYGALAKSLTYPEDRSWISFTLHPEARFHDGKPVTAEDVIFSFNTLLEKGNPYFRFQYGDVEKVIATSKREVKFVFKNNLNRELALVVGQFPILPKHFWQDKDFSESSLNIPIGSGPYTIEKFEAGRQVVFKRVADYWAKDLPVNRGMYNFDRIAQDYYQDENVALEAFKAGEYDIRRERVSRLWAVSYTGPALTSGKIIKKEFPDHTAQGIQAFFLNLRKDKFKNMALRKALNLAFDFEWTNQNLFYGAYKRSNSYFTNSELASFGLPQGRELTILNEFRDQLPASVFTEAYVNPLTDGSGRNRKNLREAKKLLDAAGYKIVDGQLIDPLSGKPVEMAYLLTDSAMERVVNPFARNLERLGIKLSLQRVDSSQYINRIRKFDYDLFSALIPQSLSPGNEQRSYWTSGAATVEGSQNYMGIEHPVVDALVERMVSAEDREELVFHTRALDRVLMHQHYLIPHWFNDTHRVAYWDKFSMPATLPLYDTVFTTTPHTWWHDEKKAKRLESK